MNSRAVAAKILVRVLQDGQSLTATLEALLAPVSSAQERAFIQALCYGVLRHYYSLESILNYLVPKPLKAKEPGIKILALIGLYQLKYMRVKDHAAVSETVAALKRQTWAKGLLNGLFRRYLREQETITQQLNNQAEPHYDHPAWLITRIKQAWPEHAENLLAANNRQPPLVLRVNQAKFTRAAYLQKLADADIAASATPHSPVGIILNQALPVEQLPEFATGSVSVQDTAAQLAAYLLDVRKGQRVLDLCAAPGGKSAHILELQPDLKELWAIDNDPKRLQRITDNLQRLGLQANVCVGDATTTSWWDGQPFERILVDAPCSALGVIRRHPDIKFLRLEEDILPLQALQQAILEQAWQVLALGGILLYATCSILKEENEAQILSFLNRHPDAAELTIEASWGLSAGVGRQILPGMDEMDGFYYARLIKNA